MTVVILIAVLSLLIAGGFLAAFFWAVRSGQYEDEVTPAMRMLLDDETTPSKPSVDDQED